MSMMFFISIEINHGALVWEYKKSCIFLLLLWKNRFLFGWACSCEGYPYFIFIYPFINSFIIHRFIHTLQNYLLNSWFVPGTVSSMENTMINMADGSHIQLTVCGYSYNSVT